MRGNKANARIRVEQDVNQLLKNLKLKTKGHPRDDVPLTTDSQYEHYEANEDRIIFKDGLLFKIFLGETGNVKYYQSLIRKQIFKEVLRSLHGEFGKHRRTAKTIIADKKRNPLPKKAQVIRKWVLPCEQRIKESRIDLTQFPLQNPNEHTTAPEDAMQLNVVPELPPSGVAVKTLAQPRTCFPALSLPLRHPIKMPKAIAKVTINIMTKHASLPTTLPSDKDSASLSHVNKEVADILGITLKYATTKHAKTIGLLE